MTTAARARRTGPGRGAAPRPAASDQALLVAVAAGDGEACRQFVTRHAAAVFGVALSVCGDRGLAEDVAQQAFERAWRHAADFDPTRASARTWLLVIARRLAIDERRRRRASPVAPELLVGMIDGASPDTERTALAGVERDRVARALAALPEAQRRAVVLAALGGRSASEIAHIEGVPLGTAKTRVRLGMQRLRSLIGQEADDG